MGLAGSVAEEPVCQQSDGQADERRQGAHGEAVAKADEQAKGEGVRKACMASVGGAKFIL